MRRDSNGTFFALIVNIFLSLTSGACIIAMTLGAIVATVWDISQLVNGEITPSEKNGNAHVENSYKILTPWVQWFYAFYLNHIREDTKDIIHGSSIGAQFEWMCHNIAYCFYSAKQMISGNDYTNEINSAASVDVGKTIFADDAHPQSTFMYVAYWIIFLPFAIIDNIINGGTQGA